MAERGGRADLPLHGGRVPPWLATRMAKLGRVLVEAIVLEYGRDELFSRLSHPFWFQCFGAVMGMDWHSSGITTSVIGALKRGLAPVSDELGIHVCGGRGRHSRKTPDELRALGTRLGLDADTLVRASRLVAKVDSAAVQDGFQIYLHSFIVADDGSWVVVQQGMNGGRKQARRYHWRSEGLRSFVDDPHAAIDGDDQGEIVNLADRRAETSRNAQLELLKEGPTKIAKVVSGASSEGMRPVRAAQSTLPFMTLPGHHDVRSENVVMRRVHGALAAAHERGPKDFADLLLVPGVGARTMLSLAMAAEVVHGAPCRFTDPARYSLALGGKDGHPYPVPLRVYDATLRVFRHAVDRAKLGDDTKMSALRRLDQASRRLERNLPAPWSEPAPRRPTFDELVETEKAHSHHYGGMTVFGPATRPDAPKENRPAKSARRPKKRQLDLFG